MSTGLKDKNWKTEDGDRKPADLLSVFVVEDHPIVRMGLAEMMSRDRFEICGEAENHEKALKGIRDSRPDVVIMDLSLGKEDGVQLIHLLKEKYADLPILVFSMHEDVLHIRKSMQAGAKGYVTKKEMTEVLEEAIQKVHSGSTFVSQRIATVIADHMTKPDAPKEKDPLTELSDREKEVYFLIGLGYSYREIADKINLSPKTIESYIDRIRWKLDIGSSRDLLRHAIQNSQHALHDEK